MSGHYLVPKNYFSPLTHVTCTRAIRSAARAAIGFVLAAGIGVASARAEVDMRVNYVPSLDVAPLFVGIDQGFFKQEGITIIPTPTAGAAAGVPGLMSGAFDVMYSNIVSTFLAEQQQFDIKIIGAGTQQLPVPVLSSGLIARTGEGIKTGKDLDGKVIATNTRSNIIWLFARAWIEKTGGDVNKVRFKEVPFPQMADALRKKQVDAAFVLDPFFNAALAEKETFEFVDVPYRAAQPNVEIGHYISTNAYLTKNPDAIAGFNRAMRKAVAWYNANRTSDDAVRIISGYTKLKPESINRAGLSSMRDRVDLATLAKTVELMKENGLMTASIDLKNFVIPDVRQ